MPKKPKKNKKEQYIKFCPKCKYVDVSRSKVTHIQKLGALPHMYICNHCGHTGYQFPEVEISELGHFQKEVDKRQLRDTKKDKTELVDTAYGKFEVRVIWKITAPILLIIGIIFLSSQYYLYGSIVLLVGLFMVYITYFKKRKLKDD